MRRRTTRGAAAAGAVAGLLLLAAVPTASPAAGTGATTTPPPAGVTPGATTPGVVPTTPTGAPVVGPTVPACANAIQVVVGTATQPPVPIPPPASSVGGARLAAAGLQLATGVPKPPAVPAAAWLVADATTGQVLASCNAHVQFMPASTLKVLTALALEPKVDPKATYVALAADAQIDGTKVGLSPGSTYTGDDLWHGLLMSSGNDAAHALADLAGGPTAAAELMRAEARRLGALDTVPVNTSGLDAPGQVSSVYDLALFARAALARPYLAKILTTRTYDFPGKGIGNGKARKRYQIQNHNRLLAGYPGATGVKNGYTVQAGGSFVGTATRGTRSYVAVVLRADGRTSEMARQLLDWAFLNGGLATAPVGRLVTPEDVVAGRLDDAGTPVPGATATPSVGPTAPGGTVPAQTTAPTATAAPSVAAAPTGGSTAADGWAAALVLGLVFVFGAAMAVALLGRARKARAELSRIIPGLLSQRLGRPPRVSAGPDGERGLAFPELHEPDAEDDAPAKGSADAGENGSTNGASPKDAAASVAGRADDRPDRAADDA